MAANKQQADRIKEVAQTQHKTTVSEDKEVDEETKKRAFSVAEQGTTLRKVKLKSLRSPTVLKLSCDHQYLIYEHSSGRPKCMPGGKNSKMSKF